MKKCYWLSLWVLVGLLSSCIYVVEEPVVIFDARDAFVGRFEVDEYSVVYDDFTGYNMQVTKSQWDDPVVWFSNFYGVDIDVYGEVSGVDVQIPRQQIGNYEIEGYGYLTNEGNVRLFFSFVEHRLFRDLVDECDAVLYPLY